MKLQHPSVTAVLLVVAKLLCLEMSLCCFDSGYRHKLTALSQTKEDVRIFLFPNGKNAPIPVHMQPNISLEGVPYNPTRNSTVFIIHGIASKVLGAWPEELGKVIASKGNYNVFGVEWSNDLLYYNIPQSVAKMERIPQEISRFILYLQKEHKLSLNNVHLIGHNLGGHIAGYASQLSGRVGRITALDVIGPLFKEFVESYRELSLKPSDACFVDAIETTMIPGPRTGNEDQIGDVNFNINARFNMTGCYDLHNLKRLEDFVAVFQNSSENTELVMRCMYEPTIAVYTDDLQNTDCTAWGYEESLHTSYISSLGIMQEPTFPENATSWDVTSYTPLGFDTIKFPGRGKFHLYINKKSPYCIRNPVADKKFASIIIDRVPELEIREWCRDKGIRNV